MTDDRSRELSGSQVIHGDALDLPLPDESVDLIVTSPPYLDLRSYQDDGSHFTGQIGSEESKEAFLENLWGATREMQRVLKATGSIFVNLGDKYVAKGLVGLPWRYAIGCIDNLGLLLRAELIWNKPNGVPESVTDRVRRSHENWFHFTKGVSYFSATDEIREKADNDNLGKLPGSVWSIASEALAVPAEAKTKLDLPDHFAAFPTEWPRRLILGWSPSGICVECEQGRRPVIEKTLHPNKTGGSGGVRSRAASMDLHDSGQRLNSAYGLTGKQTFFGYYEVTIVGYSCGCPEPSADTRKAVVLDPFGGTGTTALIAETLGRVGISLDLSHDYCRLAEWRINRSGHGKKALSRTWADRQEGLAV